MRGNLVERALSCRGLAAGLAMLLLMLTIVPGLAQTGPNTMNFQGRLLDAGGDPVTEPRCLRFRLCVEAECGEPLWPLPDSEYEYHLVTPESGSYKAGLFTVALGSVHAIEPTLMYDFDTLFLEIGVAPPADPCSDLPPEEWDTMEPRSQVRTSAYAQRSRRVRTTESDDGYLVEVTNTGSGGAMYGETRSTTAGTSAGYFEAVGATGQTFGVSARSTSGIGVRGVSGGPSGQATSAKVGVWGDTSDGIGVLGYTGSTTVDMAGVAGWATAASGQTYGVWGSTSSDSGYGVYGKGTQIGARGVGGTESGTAANGAAGVWGDSRDGTGVYGSSTYGYGVYGTTSSTSSSDTTYGLYGRNASSSGAGVYGTSDDASGLGVHGNSTNADGVRGSSVGGKGVHGTSTNGYGVYGSSANGHGVYSEGDAHVEGDLTWRGKTGYVSVPAAAFIPLHASQGIQTGDWFRALDGAPLGPHGVAPLQLPHGATITKLWFFWKDGSENDTATLDLQFLLRNGNPFLMADVDTNDGNPGVPSSSYTTIIHDAVIDNASYAYRLLLSMSDDPDANKYIHVYGALIEYTFSEPY